MLTSCIFYFVIYSTLKRSLIYFFLNCLPKQTLKTVTPHKFWNYFEIILLDRIFGDGSGFYDVSTLMEFYH